MRRMSRVPRLLAAATALAVLGGLTATSPTVAAPTTAPARELSTGVTFPTRTVTDAAGNTLLADAHGRAMQLRGANRGKFTRITESEVADFAAAGFTLLRLPIQWRRVEPVQGEYDQDYLAYVQDVLDWADTYGVLVLVDWHQDVFGEFFGTQYGFDGAPTWATRTDGIEFERAPGNWFNSYWHPAVQAAFKHLWGDADLQQAQVATWTHLAELLAGSPALLGYDLFNEPMAKSEATLGEMYDRVIAGIRTVDQRSWLFVEPTVLVGEGFPTMLPGFDDPRAGADRIGYAPHAYSTAVEDGGDWDTSSYFVSTYEEAIVQYPREHDMPVIVGEWGPASAGPDFPGNMALVKRQVASFTRFASGWTVWYGCRSEAGTGYCVFTEDGHLDPERSGAWVPYALALGGKRIKEGMRAGRYTMTYRPKAGVGGSRFVVPSGFGDRISVKVSGGGKASVSAPSPTGARTVQVGGRVAKGATWTVAITAR